MTISTLTTIIPNPLFSNILFIEKVKQDVGMSNSNNEYVPLREISGFGKAVQEVIVDSKDNIYFCIEGISDLNNGLYKLSVGSNTPMKINNSSSVISIAIDSKDDIYFSKDDLLFLHHND